MRRPSAVIFDLDGTLASCEHRRRFLGDWEAGNWIERLKPDWVAFFEALSMDAPVPVVVGLMRALRSSIVPILVSGRPDGWRYQTEWWLMEHALDRHAGLFMRPQGDGRPDPVVKHDLLHGSILPRFNVVYAVDDRPQVAAVWREHGIPVLLVKDPGLDPIRRSDG